MNTQEREQIGRLIRRFAAKAATDDLLVLIAETDGLLETCKRLLGEAKDPVTAAWLQSECEAAKTRPNLFLAEIEDILTVIKPSQEHADLYALLELEPGSGREAIKRNYRRLSRRYHPDAGGSEGDEDTFIRITRAYQQLMAYAETAATELPAPRRENSHWRRSLVPDITEARRTQKRRNVVMVALLSLTLIFVSLLAARTYNSRVMMSGLKNKSLALVPPTVGDQTPPATTPSAPTTASAEAQPPPKNPTTTAATQSPTLSDKHAAKVGCAPRTNCDPSATTTASTEAQPAPKDTPSAPTSTPSKASAPTAEPENLATTEPALSTDEPPVQLTPGNRMKTSPPPTVAAHHQAAVQSDAAPSAVAPKAQEKPTEPAATAQHQPAPTAPTTATAQKQPTRQPAPAPASATAAPAAKTLASSTGPQPIAAEAKPTPAPVAARKTPADEPAAKPTIAATQPPPAEHAVNVGRAARTESTPPAANTAQQPTTGQANKKNASSAQSTQPANEPTARMASTSNTTGTTTQKAKPEAAIPAALAAATKAEPQPPKPQPRERIDAFLHAYTAAYEQKNLPTFARFFAADATENGKTLNEVLSAYRELFTTAQTLRFTVSPQDYEHREGQLHLRGRFTIAMTFKDEGTKSGQGDITFRLTDTTPPQVQTLRYTFDQ